ncbi:TolB family protein [Solitalea canadensis]|uniref:Periplasmic component of the Tol biopolymer transport system n=1 Tax=Solitalea canadensis (strain ATCC 29591 / DSM 3403 / JCM 21819 / LMG 8368 / NBRC 15130 / NCIMB 12057 / USAM 9D) TaxID=929556 RepID=H8KUF3_SOLCM|nr:hypothetical protein [Solitalea canadensis]AFD07318.1 hypothetical protein Solca_2276 [Solitalea canadensis DSM 3403]
MRHLYRFKYLFISILTTLILTNASLAVFGQVFDNGQNPPSLKWKQIKTENYQVIFPSGFEKEAERTANVLEHLYNYVGRSLKTKSRKISIILQNQSVSSNGFVTLAPRHSEFYTTPPQDLEPNDWINSLAVHELRHVVQIDKTTSGINIPLIEEIQFAVFGGVFPIWFIEGDAVVTETVLSSSGRGRLPDWEKEFRANTLSGAKYSYSKYYFGSLKDNIPDYYRLGYFMSAKMRRDYGDSVYNALFTRAKNKFYIPWPFSNSLRHFTGYSTNQFFHQAVADLKNNWQKQLTDTKSITYNPINIRKNSVSTDYELPKALDSNEIICLKKGLADVASFVKIDKNGHEKKMLTIGPQLTPHFDLKNNTLVWDEIRYDPRFQYHTYSVICTYNLTSKTFKQLTKQSKYFSPALSSNGKTIAAVKISEANNFNIVLLNAETGEEIKTLENAANYFLQTPSFNANGDQLVYAVSSNLGRNIAVYDLTENREKLLLTWDFKQSLRPVFFGEKIIYHSSYNGIDNIYCFDTASKTNSQLTNAGIGVYNPSIDQYNQRILFNDFVKTGLNISAIPTGETTAINPEKTPSEFIQYYKPMIAREQGKSILDSFPSLSYKITPYKEASHLINFHSLSPYTQAGENDNYTAGISLKSNNLLNTMGITLGYSYDQSVKSGEYNASIAYKKFFPIFSLNYNNRKRTAVFDTLINNKETFREFSFRENKFDFSVSIPLSFYKSNYNYSVGFTSEISYISRYDINGGPKNLVKTINFPIDNTLYFYRTARRSARDINPKWGEQISIRYNSLPFDDQLDGSIFTVESSFFFPGLFKHHSFLASFNYQHNTGIYQSAVEIPEVSGAGNISRTSPLESTLLLRYRFPLFYPDWELSRFAYIKRFKGGFFADAENITSSGEFKSYGVELRADCNLLRYYLPNYDIGTKVIFFTDKGINSPVFQLIFNFTL